MEIEEEGILGIFVCSFFFVGVSVMKMRKQICTKRKNSNDIFYFESESLLLLRKVKEEVNECKKL